jgi:hypothetical protein
MRSLLLEDVNTKTWNAYGCARDLLSQTESGPNLVGDVMIE